MASQHIMARHRPNLHGLWLAAADLLRSATGRFRLSSSHRNCSGWLVSRLAEAVEGAVASCWRT